MPEPTAPSPESTHIAAVLAEHQMVAKGMGFGSPDRCRCGAETLPESGDEYPDVRRDRAFALHQAEVLSTPAGGEG